MLPVSQGNPVQDFADTMDNLKNVLLDKVPMSESNRAELKNLASELGNLRDAPRVVEYGKTLEKNGPGKSSAVSAAKISLCFTKSYTGILKEAPQDDHTAVMKLARSAAEGKLSQIDAAQSDLFRLVATCLKDITASELQEFTPDLPARIKDKAGELISQKYMEEMDAEVWNLVGKSASVLVGGVSVDEIIGKRKDIAGANEEL